MLYSCCTLYTYGNSERQRVNTAAVGKFLIPHIVTVTGPTVLYSSWMMCFQLRYQKCLDAHARSAVQTKHQMAETGREPKVHLELTAKHTC